MSNNRVIIGSLPGLVPGLRFFAPLEPGPGRGAKIDNTLPKKKKYLPGSQNSTRV